MIIPDIAVVLVVAGQCGHIARQIKRIAMWWGCRNHGANPDLGTLG
jgi:hypothetical protein